MSEKIKLPWVEMTAGPLAGEFHHGHKAQGFKGRFVEEEQADAIYRGIKMILELECEIVQCDGSIVDNDLKKAIQLLKRGIEE